MSFPRVLGVDPSLAATGLAHPDGRLATVDTKPSGPHLTARANRLDVIVDYVAAAAYGCDLVVIEGPSMGEPRQAGTFDRWGLWWLIVDNLTAREVVVEEVPPATLKKFATGRGNATKADMRVALVQRAGLDLRDDNQVDAWWLRAFGHQRLGHPIVNLPAAQAKLAAPTLSGDEVTS